MNIIIIQDGTRGSEWKAQWRIDNRGYQWSGRQRKEASWEGHRLQRFWCEFYWISPLPLPCQPICSKSKTLRILFALWSVFAARRNRNDFGRWRTGSSRWNKCKIVLEKHSFLFQGDGTWVLAEGFNSFLGKVVEAKVLEEMAKVTKWQALHCSNKSAKPTQKKQKVLKSVFEQVLHCPDWPREGRVAMLKLLAFGAEQDDIVLILHMDRYSITTTTTITILMLRRDHLLMNYAQQFDRLSTEEQEELARLWWH